eukprot:374074-Pelagomonas_calceolata.AAC.1
MEGAAACPLKRLAPARFPSLQGFLFPIALLKLEPKPESWHFSDPGSDIGHAQRPSLSRSRDHSSDTAIQK